MNVESRTVLSRLLDEALDLSRPTAAPLLEGLSPEHERLKPRLLSLLRRADGALACRSSRHAPEDRRPRPAATPELACEADDC